MIRHTLAHAARIGEIARFAPEPPVPWASDPGLVAEESRHS